MGSSLLHAMLAETVSHLGGDTDWDIQNSLLTGGSFVLSAEGSAGSVSVLLPLP